MMVRKICFFFHVEIKFFNASQPSYTDINNLNNNSNVQFPYRFTA